MKYQDTIRTLFRQLAQANQADSNNAEAWQQPDDANQQDGLYGHLRSAIIAIAGEAIVEHWAKTNEVDLTLANRQEQPKLETTIDEYTYRFVFIHKFQHTEAKTIIAYQDEGVVQFIASNKDLQTTLSDLERYTRVHEPYLLPLKFTVIRDTIQKWFYNQATE